jgi:hypothetical protein
LTHYASVVFRRESRVLGSKSRYNPPKAKIHPSSHERRTNSQAANLNQKAVLAPAVLPAHDAPCITDDLTDETEYQSNVESGASAGDNPSDNVADQRSGEYGEKGSIGSEVDAILIVSRYIFAVLGLWVFEAVIKQAALVNPCLIGKIWNVR